MVSARSRARALAAFGLSSLILVVGIFLAARRYPGGFDWAYTVVSALASRKHNPGGAAFFAAALCLSLALLWPIVPWIAARNGPARGLARFGSYALRAGILLGIAVGVERLVFHHFSDDLRKGHEVLALLCFLGLYAGVLALHAQRVRGRTEPVWVALLVAAPLLCIGLSQLALYLDPRDLGWVDPSWRELGVPAWLSFACWQWLAVAALWGSIGHLVVAVGRGGPGAAQ